LAAVTLVHLIAFTAEETITPLTYPDFVIGLEFVTPMAVVAEKGVASSSSSPLLWEQELLDDVDDAPQDAALTTTLDDEHFTTTSQLLLLLIVPPLSIVILTKAEDNAMLGSILSMAF